MPTPMQTEHDRDYTLLDRALMRVGRGLARLQAAAPSAQAAADYPAARIAEAPMQPKERRHVAGLMRINHAGEVSAQALYHGQALVARKPGLRAHLLKAADEERAHLDWCDARLRELGERPSRLGPFWYVGSFAIGAAAGLVGDRVSLGFVKETERQVIEHLDEHLGQIPRQDRRSRAIIHQMKEDEARHGQDAAAAGALPLPAPVRGLMRGVAKVMKFGAYRV